MLNPFSLLLWVGVALALLLWVYVTYLNVLSLRATKQLTIIESTKICTVAAEQLTEVTTNLCCRQGSTLTTNRKITLGNLPVVINPVSTYYLEACKGFCSTGVSQDGQACLLQEETSKYQDCLTRTRPQNCQGLAMPVARVGKESYYVKEATHSSCQVVEPCSSAG